MPVAEEVVYKDLGRRIRELRTSAGLTQEECAKSLGISTVGYLYYESGQRRISIAQLVKLAGILKCSVSYFISESGSEEAREIWEHALKELELQLARANYRTWYQKTVGLSYQDDQFVVGVPNVFVAEYLDKNQRDLIEKTVIGCLGHDTRVFFRVNMTNPNMPDVVEDSSDTQLSLPGFNKNYTFDSFIVGSNNRLAHAAALDVANSMGQSFNPLYIHGKAGLGKTHLLHAIGQVAQAKRIRVICVSSEQFTNEWIRAVQHKEAKEFRERYKNVSILLFDDIQFISGNRKTEESFSNTFDELHNANHQIVITSDRPSKALPLLEDRVRSRLNGGLIVEIQPPDFETRLAILQVKAERQGIDIAPDVLELIASRVKENVRELEGCLNRVAAYSRLHQTMITPEFAEKIIAETKLS